MQNKMGSDAVLMMAAVLIATASASIGTDRSIQTPPPPSPTAPSPGPCDGARATMYTWCDLSQSFETRASLLVANLTNEEKSVQFRTDNGPTYNNSIPRLAIPGFRWWREALHGMWSNTGHAGTVWPEPIGVASSFNTTLFHALGDLTSTECRADLEGLGGTFWAPNVNNFRDPRWGRGQETPGEDPTLSSSYAANFVKGMQGSDPKYLKVSACLKHYSAYSQETGRLGFAANVTSTDMFDTYLPAFEAGIVDGNASGIMCSYNAETFGAGLYGKGQQYGAIPSCANSYAMNELARDKWGFDGYVTSDCGAADGVGGAHRYTSGYFETLRGTIGAGMDVDCGGATQEWSPETMLNMLTQANTTKIMVPVVNTALNHLFKVRMRLGHFDPRKLQPWSGYGPEHINTTEHIALSLDAAEQGFVLLKNLNNALPLTQKSGADLAILGPHANATGAMLGNYHGAPALKVLSPCTALDQQATRAQCIIPVNCSIGGNATCIDSDVFSAVNGASAAIIFIGLDGTQESEGRDRTSLTPPGSQVELVQKVGQAAKSRPGGDIPVVLVIISGGAIDLSEFKGSSNVDAIVWAGYPGQSGGTAIANALFGKVNKWGKLPVTWYDEGFCSVASLENYNMRPNTTTGYPGRSHRFYTGTPVYRFGDGLSYTKFSYEIHPSAALAGKQNSIDISKNLRLVGASFASSEFVASFDVDITNSGDLDGDDVVLLFLQPPEWAVSLGSPRQTLASFTRVTVNTHMKTSVRLGIRQAHFIIPNMPDIADLAMQDNMWTVRVGNHNRGQPKTEFRLKVNYI